MTWPLTEAQEGLWYFQALDPANPILNTGQYLDLRGDLDRAALRAAMAQVLAGAEALRLRFHQQGAEVRQYLADAPVMAECDLSAHPDPQARALALMRADHSRAPDLARDPVAAFTLFRLGAGRHWLYQRVHHLAIDGYGMVLLTNAIGAHYSAIRQGAAPPAAFPPYSRAIDDDAAWRASARRAAQGAWWQERLADQPEAAGPAPGLALSGPDFLRETRHLSPAMLAPMAGFAAAHDLHWTDVLTALAGAYLARWTGGDVTVGLPFMARMGRPIARLPCMAMNVLPQRIRPDEDAPLSDWITLLATDMREGRRHGQYRSEQLRRDLGLIGGGRRLYGPLINLQPFDLPPVFDGLDVGLHILGAGAVDDLTLTFRGTPEAGMIFEVDANPALYSPRDVAGHANRLPGFIARALAAGRLAPVATASPDEARANAAPGRGDGGKRDVALARPDGVCAPKALPSDADRTPKAQASLDGAGRDHEESGPSNSTFTTTAAGPHQVSAVEPLPSLPDGASVAQMQPNTPERRENRMHPTALAGAGDTRPPEPLPLDANRTREGQASRNTAAPRDQEDGQHGTTFPAAMARQNDALTPKGQAFPTAPAPERGEADAQPSAPGSAPDDARAPGALPPAPNGTLDNPALDLGGAFSNTHPVPDTTLAALIEAQMRASPDAPALTYGDETLSYAELDRRSAALAGRLAALGAGPESIVAVALERSVELSVALVAVLRAGAAYLPLDPEHPPARIADILAQARPVVTLTSPDLAARLPDIPRLLSTDWPLTGPAPASGLRPGNMAYVIFTSGSTGAPKGVVIEHRAIVNRLLWMRDHYRFTARDRILQKTPASFDVSVWELFLPYISGAHLVMAPPGAHRDPAALAGLICRHRITTAHFVPSMLSAFLASPASDGLALARVFCSGEELSADLRDRFHRRIRAELHNLYGPTEAAVDVSYWPAGPDDRSDPLPIGWPIWNTRLAVLDDRMRPVPPGLAGNLYLGGVQLARGYLGRPDLTAERFITHKGARLYATGDLARLRHDGAVVYLGRSDHQVKIRGLRIELGEIEAAIMATGFAVEAVVIARDDRLLAYLVPAPGYRPGDLARALAAHLPGYMIPQAEVALDCLPVTANGKLDRKALPAPVFAATGRAAETGAEHLLARLYAEILRLPEPPPATADFFALGGDSLSAVELVLRIGAETGAEPGLGAVFAHPVIEDMARNLRADGLQPLLRLTTGAAPPLFIIHPAGGLGWGYRRLAQAITPAREVWAIQHPGLDPDHPMPASLRELATDYAARIAAMVDGPMHLAGWSVGGLIAQDIARSLHAMGRAVGMVALLDSYPADVWRAEPDPDPAAALRALLAIAGHDPDAHPELDSRDKVVGFLRAGDTPLGSLPARVLDGVVRVVTDTNRMVRDHQHRRFDGTLLHIRAGCGHEGRVLTAALWRDYGAGVRAVELPFLHAEMIGPQAVAQIAPILSDAMARADRGEGGC